MPIIATSDKADNIRNWLTTVMVAVLVVLFAASWLFPKNTKVEEKTLKLITQASQQLERASKSIDESSRVQAVLSEKLSAQLSDLNLNRESSYERLVNEYGIPDTNGDVVGVRPQDNHK